MSVESEILVRYRDSLHSLISGSIIGLSVKATTANLLTTEEQEKCTQSQLSPSEQANKFMQYITHRVNNDPSTLSVFINKVIGLEPTFAKTAREMLSALEHAKENLVTAVQEVGAEQAGGENDTGFSESLSVRSLSDWLKSERLHTDDCSKLRDEQVSGSCFLDLKEKDLRDMKISFGGRSTILKLQEKIQGSLGGAGGTATASTNTLEISHLRFVVNQTWDARNQWQQIGRDLGIDQATLVSIDTAKRGRADDCYPEMLSVWLRRDQATWETLLGVLASDPVGFEQLACKVRGLPAEKKRMIGFY